MNNCILSVILPCYNVAQYIERAMESIFEQDFHDYEVIIINDGSPDNLLDVCKQWECLDNVTIITTPNQGLSQARNEGLNVAKGKYVYFMDPDDFILKGMFSKVLKVAEDGNYDAVHFGSICVEQFRGNYTYELKSKYQEYTTNKSIIEDYLPKFIGLGQEDFDYWKKENPWHNKEFSSVWRFVFKRSVLIDNNIYFRKGVTLIEDRLFVSLFMMYAERICNIPDIFYNYIMKADGLLVGSLDNFPKLLKSKCLGVTERELLRKKYKENKGVDIFPMYIGTIAVGALELIVRGASNPIRTSMDAIRKYKSFPAVKEAYKKLSYNRLPLKYKLGIWAIKHHCSYGLICFVKIAQMFGIRMSAF